jgi:signal transduction histidine kinase
MAESVRKKMDNTNPLALRLDRVISALQHAIRDLRQFIGELEPDTSPESLTEGLRKLAEDPHLQTLIKVRMTVNCAGDNLQPPVRTTHVLAIVNEALSNVVRHARARQVWLLAERRNGQLAVTVADDGSGMPDQYIAGFGLRNMRDRARLLGGTLRLEPRSPRGTQVVLTVPWEEHR